MIVDVSQLAILGGFLLVLFALYINALLRLKCSKEGTLVLCITVCAFLALVFMFSYWVSRYIVG